MATSQSQGEQEVRGVITRATYRNPENNYAVLQISTERSSDFLTVVGTCLNAQEEIFQASMEEVNQVMQVHPFLAKYIGPPCAIRNGIVTPKCTEGDRFCGVPVWKTFPYVTRQL